MFARTKIEKRGEDGRHGGEKNKNKKSNAAWKSGGAAFPQHSSGGAFWGSQWWFTAPALTGGKQPKEIIQVCNCIQVWLFSMRPLMSISIPETELRSAALFAPPQERGWRAGAFHQCCHAEKFLISAKPSLAPLCHLAFVCWHFKPTNSKMVPNGHFNGDTLIWHCAVTQPLKLHLDVEQGKCKEPGTLKINILKKGCFKF